MKAMRALCAGVIACCCCASACGAGPSAPARGEVFYRAAFDAPDSLAGWTGVEPGKAELARTPEGKTALRVSVPASGGPGGAGLWVQIPVERLRGWRIRCTAVVKADQIAPPPKSWNGLKVMLHVAAGERQSYPQQNDLHGTFDWRAIGPTATIPPDATSLKLHLGLEKTTGTAWFERVEIVCLAPPRPRPATRPSGPVFKGHDLPRLRGAMISPNVTRDDLRVLASWGANHIRWQLLWNSFPHSPADSGDLKAYDEWIERALAKLDECLPLCRELGILVTVDLHTPPGGRDKSLAFRLFQEKRFQDRFLELWKSIARRYRTERAVWGYDLVNEPVEGRVADGLMDWQQLAEAAARAVREIDPHHAIIVEPAPWGSVQGLADLHPIPVSGVVYSAHMYQPHEFTHQGVYDAPVGIRYPGTIGKRTWDKDAVRQALQPARDFQLDYGVHVYIGEFSAIRWAPGESALHYLRDVIDVMEEYGWDWAYHAFREWQGWSVEHGGDRNDTRRSEQPTDRQKLLQEWFGKNRRPAR